MQIFTQVDFKDMCMPSAETFEIPVLPINTIISKHEKIEIVSNSGIFI